MSGFLKNFEKTVGAQVFSQAHNLLIAPKYFRYNLANLYYEPNQRLRGLSKDHNYSCFALSSISQALIHETLLFQNLETVVESKNEELITEIHLNINFAQQCLFQAQSLVKAGRWAQETDVASQIIYATEQGRNMQNQYPDLVQSQTLETDKLYKDHICPSILSNLNHLSSQNVTDITIGLVNANYLDVEFWKPFLNHIINKISFTSKHNSIEYEGWNVSQYEYSSGKKNIQMSHTDVKIKKFLTQGTKTIQVFAEQAILEAWIMIWLPYVQRERRVQYIFKERDELDNTQLSESLKQLGQSLPELESFISDVLKKL